MACNKGLQIQQEISCSNCAGPSPTQQLYMPVSGYVCFSWFEEQFFDVYRCNVFLFVVARGVHGKVTKQNSCCARKIFL